MQHRHWIHKAGTAASQICIAIVKITFNIKKYPLLVQNSAVHDHKILPFQSYKQSVYSEHVENSKQIPLGSLSHFLVTASYTESVK